MERCVGWMYAMEGCVRIDLLMSGTRWLMRRVTGTPLASGHVTPIYHNTKENHNHNHNHTKQGISACAAHNN